MGYELHITRADDWTASSSAAIRPDEWARAARDAGLRPETAGEGEAEPDWLMGGHGGAELRLWLLEGRVDVAGAHSDDHIEQLLLLAASIDARLIGDDGELYPLPHAAARTMPDIKAWTPRERRRNSYRLVADGKGSMRKETWRDQLRNAIIGQKVPGGRARRRWRDR